jgi:transcriptional regulator with XRE-family HTH domain
MFLGSNIRLIRKKWGLSQEELGERLEVKGQSVSTYEKGTTEPRLQFLMKLSEMAGVSINDLCERPLRKKEIPEKPLYRPKTATPPEVREPVVAYEPLQPEDIAEPLYNIHILVSRIKKLERRVKELEEKFKKQPDKKKGTL